MNTQDDIMKALWDNENALAIAKLLQAIVMPAFLPPIAKTPEDQPIEVKARFSIGEITVEMAMKDIKQPNSKEEQK